MRNTNKGAVALEYGENEVPIVSAKGEEDLAEMILEEARRQDVYIAEDPRLLAALSQLDIENEIPQEFVEYKWSTYWHSLASVVPFKRDVYRHVLIEFLPKYIQLHND